MGKLKRNLITAVIAILVVFSFVSCGSETETFEGYGIKFKYPADCYVKNVDVTYHDDMLITLESKEQTPEKFKKIIVEVVTQTEREPHQFLGFYIGNRMGNIAGNFSEKPTSISPKFNQNSSIPYTFRGFAVYNEGYEVKFPSFALDGFVHLLSIPNNPKMAIIDVLRIQGSLSEEEFQKTIDIIGNSIEF
jgi:hypothetical protein